MGGTLDLSGGKFRNPDGRSVDAAGARIGGDLLCQDGFEAEGEVRLSGANIAGGVYLSGGKFREASGNPIVATNAWIGKDLFCQQGFEADGWVSLAGTHVGGAVDLSGGKFRNRGADAITADGLQVGQSLVCGEGFEADGQLRLLGVRVAGTIVLTGEFRNVHGYAINADGAQVGEHLVCGKGFKAKGEVVPVAADIGGQLHLRGAEFDSGEQSPHGEPGWGVATRADRVRVRQSMVCGKEFITVGKLVLNGAHLNGLEVTQGSAFRNPGACAMDAQNLHIDGPGFWQPEKVDGTLNLAFARAALWSDNRVGRKTPTVLHGFQYAALSSAPEEAEANLDERLEWLNNHPDVYSPQSYGQLAGVYRNEGEDAKARAVLIASENRRRRRGQGLRSWPRRAWGRLLWATVAYGYRPWVALLWLIALVVTGALIIESAPDELTASAGAPDRNVLLYTVDVLLPFIDLGYDKWIAHGGVLAVATVLTILGWVLATAVIAAFAGVLRRGD